jgi:hypothetical protein
MKLGSAVPAVRILKDRGRQRAAWLLLLFIVALFAVGSSRHWFPQGLIGPIENMATPTSVILKELLQVFIVLTVFYALKTRPLLASFC